ncbi:MAG: YcxB family protein [Cytophagales bacterium]|nr:YcxB family protein [Cytophagales bacterium]
MLVQTKKYELSKELYIKKAFKNILRKQWWVLLIYAVLNCGTFFAPSWWWFSGATIALVLYMLFWLIQFAGITQHEQGKMLFEKLAYEITSQQILIKVNTKQGMPIRWDQVKKAGKDKDGFYLWLSPVQLIHWPFKSFKSEAQIKFVETLLRRKNFIK